MSGEERWIHTPPRLFGDVRPTRHRGDPPRRGQRLYDIRGFGAKRGSRPSTTSCSSAPRSALSARGLSRDVRDLRHARHALCQEADRARDSDHDRRHELRRAVGDRQGSARAAARPMGTSTTTGDGGMTDGGARRPRRCWSTRCCRRATASIRTTCAAPTPSRSWSARAPSPAAAACCSARRSPSAWPRCAPCPQGIDQRSACRHPDWTGPDDLAIKILELREITDWEKPIYVKIGATRALRREARGERRRGRDGASTACRAAPPPRRTCSSSTSAFRRSRRCGQAVRGAARTWT